MLPRARAVMLTGYNEVARFVGLDPYEMLLRARIQAAALHDPEDWLPASRVLALIDDSATLSDRDDFAVLLGTYRTFTSLGPVSLLLKHEATVRDFILAAKEFRLRQNVSACRSGRCSAGSFAKAMASAACSTKCAANS